MPDKSEIDRLTAIVEALTAQINSISGDNTVLKEQLTHLLKKTAKGADAASAPHSSLAPFPQHSPDPVALLKMLQEATDRGEQKTLTIIAEVGNMFKSFHQSYVEGLQAGDKIRREAVQEHLDLMDQLNEDNDSPADNDGGLGEAVEGARAVVSMVDELRNRGKANADPNAI